MAPTPDIGIYMSKPRLEEIDYAFAAGILGISPRLIKTVALVESKGAGFDPEGFPKTLFEAHIFHKETDGKYDKSHPGLSSLKWDRTLYGKGWQAEKARLAEAIKLDRIAAFKSASWGVFQIMGFNYEECGCVSVQEFVNSNCHSERSQLLLFCAYIQNRGLLPYLASQNWAAFAKKYNGPGYAENKYDIKLRDAYASFSNP